MNAALPAPAVDMQDEVPSDPEPDPIAVRKAILEGENIKTDFLAFLAKEHGMILARNAKALCGYVRGKLGILVPITGPLSPELSEVWGTFRGVRYRFVA